ncbi:MAG TPA: ABC transporter substrate-binding protein [Dehalococcoidia bacterium]|nr:ABC transporter substrate-binding protein [Dehalococcoidia bacterium]
MPRRLFTLIIPLLASIALLAAACTDDDASDSTSSTSSDTTTSAAVRPADATPAAAPRPVYEAAEITFVAGFRPQANLPFVAVYVAAAEGYFADEQLTVQMEHSPRGGHLQLLLEKEIEFTTATASQALRRRADELPVRSVALFGQRGDQGYVVMADSGIEGPADFAGRSVGFKGSVIPAELKAMLAAVDLTEDDINLQNVPFDVRPFIEGQVDVFPVFLNNEPDQIRNEGVEITIIDPTEFGVPTLGLTFLAHEDTIADDPQLVERFLRATLRGAAFAAANIDAAVEITLQHAEGADPAHQRFLLETDLENAQRADGIGRGTLDQWDALEELLMRYEVIEVDVDTALAFDGSFVDALYGADGVLK